MGRGRLVLSLRTGVGRRGLGVGAGEGPAELGTGIRVGGRGGASEKTGQAASSLQGRARVPGSPLDGDPAPDASSSCFSSPSVFLNKVRAPAVADSAHI